MYGAQPLFDLPVVQLPSIILGTWFVPLSLKLPSSLHELHMQE